MILGKQEQQQLTMEEQRVASLILEHNGAEYDSMLRDADWEVFYQMSPMREGLLNWYPFSKNCEILEISDGFGALTGVLARTAQRVTVLEENVKRAECIAKRYENLDNVIILAGMGNELPIEQTFDYVIVEKEVNTSYALEQLIGKVYPFLKETGRLLFVCENRFGMKYWCGVPDSFSGQPFAGIRGRSGAGRLNRQELIEVLEKNKEIAGWRLYYPFPDYKLPQAVYTDGYLPKESVRDRVIPYYSKEEQKSLVCLENEISDSLIANGVFHVFANSFLVECGKEQLEPEVLFAALSTDRGKEHGFATVIFANETVQKKMLHPEGRKSLELLHRNQQELLQHDVACVEEKLKGNVLEMPFVSGKSLIEYLKYLFFHQKDEVERIFDELYEAIQKSSEAVDFSECRLKDDRLRRENAGVILKRAYIDMIPYNSFYKEGNILFYDQEFVRECYPAKYVLFRALRYTYIYIPEAEGILPLQQFQEKYGLSDIWQVFEQEEARFVEDNRNYELLSSFYRWAGVTAKDVDDNIERLKGNKKETKAKEAPFHRRRHDLEKYKYDIRLNAIKKVQLGLLKKFAEVCESYDLSYCVFYGTLLGAVRHKGYVPWDDDVDVLMPREDYDRLLAVAEEALEHPYFLQTPESDAGCFYGGYSKLRNSSTTGIDERHRGMKCNQGIWIDIFPLDAVPGNEEAKQRQKSEIQFYQRLLMKKTYGGKRVLWEMDAQKEEYYEEVSGMFSREELCRKLHDVMAGNPENAGDKVAVLARFWRDRAYPEYDRQDFEFLTKEAFEDMEVYVPAGYEKCLIQEYGKDFACYPPEEERLPHHKAFFDTTKSYIDYMGKTEYNSLDNCV